MPTLCLGAAGGYVVHYCNTAFSDIARGQTDQLVGRPLLEVLPHAKVLSDLIRRVRDGRVAETLTLPLTGQGQPNRYETWMAWPVAGAEDVLLL